MKRAAITAMALALALGACGDDPEPAGEASGDAGAKGEVQGGTISDAMLPLDSVRSQSPPMAGESGNADGGGDGGDAGDGEAETPAGAPPPSADPEPSEPAEAAEPGEG